MNRAEINGMICDICGYEDKTELKSAVVVCRDGVIRCTPCQSKKKFGKKWPKDDDMPADNEIDHDGDTDVVKTWPATPPKSVSPMSDSGKPYNIR